MIRSAYMGLLGLAAFIGLAAGCPGCPPGGGGGDAGPDSGAPVACSENWTQWGQTPDHQGASCAEGQPLDRRLATVVYDPFVEQEQAENNLGGEGALLVHYAAPLAVDDDIYVAIKSGEYISCEPPGSGSLADGGACGSAAWNSQVWTYKRFHWEPDGTLSEKWTFVSDWKPVRADLTGGWEPVFQGAIAGNFLYVPGAGGTVYKLDRGSGVVLRHINPFFDEAPDPNTYVAGGLTADGQGNIYYTAIQLSPTSPFENPWGSWLVKVAPWDLTQVAHTNTLTVGAPRTFDSCRTVFRTPRYVRPYPPADDGGVPVYPPEIPCLDQRPALNMAPAVAKDGTIYIVTRAHGNGAYAYLVAVKPNLSLKWAASLRDRLHDGCGVMIPSDADPVLGPLNHCRIGARQGVDPRTNELPAGNVSDQASTSPVVLPDGAILYGAFTSYNGGRGHLFKFANDGAFLGSYDFGWDVTPAFFEHDGTYSVLIKDNFYFNLDGTEGPYKITQLSADLQPEWSYTNSTTDSCETLPDGGVSCVPDHPNGFEWCINAPAVDKNGTLYVNAEDGFVYAIGQGGVEKQRFFLLRALGAAYTPLTIDKRGRIYALNGGVLTILGR